MLIPDQTFSLKLLMSFFVGSIWVTSVTVFAERFGSRIGGFIGGLPSTVVVALLFIGLSQSTKDASRAAAMIPMIMGVNGLFILVYLARIKQGLIQAMITALLVWFLVVAFIIWTRVDSALFSFIIWVLTIGGWYYIVEHLMSIPQAGGIRVPYTMKQIIARGLFSGVIISIAVLIARLTGPVVGGIFANFPVIFISTLFITHQTGGAEFSRSVAKTLMISAMVNVGVYCFAAYFAYMYLDLVSGTLAAVSIAVFSGVITYRFFKQQPSIRA